MRHTYASMYDLQPEAGPVKEPQVSQQAPQTHISALSRCHRGALAQGDGCPSGGKGRADQPENTAATPSSTLPTASSHPLTHPQTKGQGVGHKIPVPTAEDKAGLASAGVTKGLGPR